ncbi:hypothetical protein [Thalassovita taeanensis]|uniref:Uncharacterized protein n=1 Tax=Thalassovita taeanensis TaxID=657014 RepID=A0A1H9KN86_9RHOB|nr:hypothetical protein [Thalassovita taeanensis]SER00313.1 hypothetical protein SAMN04488092_11943 [Thalassovita taeanensis]
MSKKRPTLFLERRSYRLRRVMDAARMLPVIGAMLWGVPLLWAAPGGDHGVSTSRAMLYVFGVWIVLSAVALFLSLWLNEGAEGDPAEGP